MNNNRIYLTGYRGTGKTTVGKLISLDLESDCVDLDTVIESAAGLSIREIFAEGGEELFREWETRCLRQTADDADSGRVISLGGGAILSSENRALISRTGVCIWLTATPATIASRIASDSTTAARRPALTDLSPEQEISAVLTRREPLYRESATFSIATDDATPEQLADDILRWLRANEHA